MRRDVDRAEGSSAREPFQGVDVEAVSIDGDGKDGGPGGSKRLPCGPISERFDGDGVAGTE